MQLDADRLDETALSSEDRETALNYLRRHEAKRGCP